MTTTQTTNGLDYETNGLTLHRATYKNGPRARKVSICEFYAKDAAGARSYMDRVVDEETYGKGVLLTVETHRAFDMRIGG